MCIRDRIWRSKSSASTGLIQKLHYKGTHGQCDLSFYSYDVRHLWIYTPMPNVFTSTHVAFIFYDSMSRLEALNEVKFELDLVQKITKDYTHLTNNGKTISFCWISSHVNIPGNEKADAAAKSALSFPITKMKLPAYDLSLIHIWRCRRIERCRSRWSPYH